jgi:hypothetical protein
MTDLEEKVAAQLEQIEKFFVAGSKVTLLVRQADDPEADVLLTNDDLAEVANAIVRARLRGG